MNFSAIGQKILAGVSATLNQIHPKLTPLSETSEPLNIARRLVSTVMDLQPWVLRTRQISPNAIRLRELIKTATDPNKVLFDDLPSLFKEHEAALSKGDVQPIIQELGRSLDELVSCYPKLIADLRKQLLDELQIDSKGASGNQEINARARNIMQVSGDFKFDAFATRLASFKGSEDDIEGIASLAADKFTAAVADEVRDHHFHPSQEIKEQPDGSIIVTFTAGGWKEMCWYLMTWEGEAEVLEPESLKKAYAEMADKIMKGIAKNGG